MGKFRMETIEGTLLAYQAYFSKNNLFEYKLQTPSKDIFLNVPARLKSIFDKCIGEDVLLKGKFDLSRNILFRAKSIKLELKEDVLEFLDFSRQSPGDEPLLHSLGMIKNM